ncbi:MAG: 3-hydroxyacyl-CoA dehydrogenase NAD-binding domain-containing protein [Syntrophomonadaceae bacterium]|nr:3-hydroxyacyl-CoA dehydrogenase NAD-binding domain-containing protein [Syntrophomonadaceae bacterium]
MKKVAVLGAGIMGAGIAQVLALGGFKVILRDLQMALVRDGLHTIDHNLNKMLDKGLIEERQKNDALSLIHGATDLAELRDVDLVIEAVVENMAVKKQIFAELDHLCPKHTILATNTSSLSITEIASATRRPEKILGMHFFNPVTAMQLVEIVKGLDTDQTSVELAGEFIKKIGKHPVLVQKESPGFIVNRIMASCINEAIFIYGEGLAQKEDIDTAMKLGAGMAFGPLEVADFIGLDVLYALLLVFYEEFRDPKYRPHYLLSTMIRAGYWGQKSGRGFYKYHHE